VGLSTASWPTESRCLVSARPRQRRPHHLLEHGDLSGRETVGRTLITLAVDDRLLERLLTFDAGAEDLEDGGDAEPVDQDDAHAPPC
jgi:hypothetical protein